MTEDAEGRPLNERHALIFILAVVSLETIGFGLIGPILPDYLTHLGHQSLSDAALDAGAMMTIYAVMGFVFGPIMGNLSDRFGRKVVLLASLGALSLDYILLANADHIGVALGISGVLVLFVGRAISGAAGMTMAPANSFIADITAPDKRAARFGLVSAAWGVGFIVGPALGGMLAGAFGMKTPLYVASAVAAGGFVFGLVMIPETLKPENRRPFKLLRANPVGALLQMRRYPVVFGLILCFVTFQIAHDANPAIWNFYTREKFGWDAGDVGLSMAFVGVCMVVVMSVVLPRVLARLGETRTACFGLVMMAAGFAGFAASTQGWMMVAMIVPFALIGLVGPSLRGIMSGAVPPNAQGELQGAVSSVQSLTMIVSPMIMTGVFNRFTGQDAIVYLPSAPFWLAAGLSVVTLLIVVGVLTRTRYERTV